VPEEVVAVSVVPEIEHPELGVYVTDPVPDEPEGVMVVVE
jgi:hypothetical protein